MRMEQTQEMKRIPAATSAQAAPSLEASLNARLVLLYLLFLIVSRFYPMFLFCRRLAVARQSNAHVNMLLHNYFILDTIIIFIVYPSSKIVGQLLVVFALCSVWYIADTKQHSDDFFT